VLGRAIGVVFSPRATYADVAAHPRAFGALVAVVAVSAIATFTFLSTEVGRNAALDQQLSAMESFGIHPNAEQLQQIEERAASSKYFAIVALAVVIPVFSLMVAGLGIAVFNAALGGTATFKQVYAIVVHSWFLPALQTAFVLPLSYARESVSSTSLAIFLPMLDDASFLGRLLGSIDLFRIWWIVSLAIGFGVLYKRRTGPIAGTLLAIYVVIALAVAGVMTSRSGG
jgi:uncharacterized membrane protein (DUF2068 family)